MKLYDPYDLDNLIDTQSDNKLQMLINQVVKFARYINSKGDGNPISLVLIPESIS